MTKYIWVLLLFTGLLANAQKDTIVLRTNELIVGEIKDMNAGVLTVETAYSDSDFKIEFNKVTELIVELKCLVVLSRGRRRFGNLRTTEPGKMEITLEDGQVENFRLNELISLQEIRSNFWHRFKGAIDLGYNLTKANNNAQFTIGGNLSYTGERWLSEAAINALNSTQDNTEEVNRLDANIQVIRLLGASKWYLLANIAYLSNTEQALDRRITPTLGFGNLLISNRKLYLGVATGLIYNSESFTEPSLDDRTSTELYLGTSFNMFDFKDLDLTSNIKLIPSLSEKKRFRTDFDLTLKYDLPYDFYVKLSYTLNYDNQPAVSGAEVDFIFTSGFGWDFN